MNRNEKQLANKECDPMMFPCPLSEAGLAFGGIADSSHPVH